MFDYVYRAKSVIHSEANMLNSVIDLGFGLPKQHQFALLGISPADGDLISATIDEELPQCDMILLKSVKRAGRYYADITYCIHDEWHNLAKQVLLRREADKRDAS